MFEGAFLTKDFSVYWFFYRDKVTSDAMDNARYGDELVHDGRGYVLLCLGKAMVAHVVALTLSGWL
jgi:hypothetical protein